MLLLAIGFVDLQKEALNIGCLLHRLLLQPAQFNSQLSLIVVSSQLGCLKPLLAVRRRSLLLFQQSGSLLCLIHLSFTLHLVPLDLFPQQPQRSSLRSLIVHPLPLRLFVLHRLSLTHGECGSPSLSLFLRLSSRVLLLLHSPPQLPHHVLHLPQLCLQLLLSLFSQPPLLSLSLPLLSALVVGSCSLRLQQRHTILPLSEVGLQPLLVGLVCAALILAPLLSFGLLTLRCCFTCGLVGLSSLSLSALSVQSSLVVLLSLFLLLFQPLHFLLQLHRHSLLHRFPLSFARLLLHPLRLPRLPSLLPSFPIHSLLSDRSTELLSQRTIVGPQLCPDSVVLCCDAYNVCFVCSGQLLELSLIRAL